jgi:hypothetical protein
MPIDDSTDGYSRDSGSSRTFDTTIHHGVSESRSVHSTEGISRIEGWSETSARTYCGDSAYIARQIFRDEVRDVLKVLRTYSALGTVRERNRWAEDLMRLLDGMGFSDLE